MQFLSDEDEVKIRDLQLLFEMLEKTILDKVTNSTGMKGVELVLHVMTILMPKTFKHEEYTQILESLVDRGEIVELEYEVPQVHRVKSIYFPKGTTFRLDKLI